MNPRAEELIARLNLEPHPEGGFYRRIYRSEMDVRPSDGRGTRPALTTIYYLIVDNKASRWHRVMSDEAWHLYEGGPVELLEIDASITTMSRHHLAPVDESDWQPVHIAAAGRWQAARSLGDYAFIGCSVGPGFDFADFKLMANDESAAARVRERWPDVASLI